MSNMAEYARIFETGTGDDWVEKRKLAVADTRTWLKALSTLEAIKLAADVATAIADGSPLPDVIANVGEQKIQSHASSFVRGADEGELQIKVILMAAVIDVVEERPVVDGGWSTGEALAAAFWSALSFQTPLAQAKVERLRQDLLIACRTRVLHVAAAARVRKLVPAIGSVAINQDSPSGAKVNTAFSKAVDPLVTSLRDNAALDREELDFLWWVLSERSDSLDEPLAAMPDETRAVVAGFDASAMLRKLPATAHKNIVLRNVRDGGELSLLELLEQLGDRRNGLAERLRPHLSESSAVFPLVYAIASGDSDSPFAREKLKASEWGARALLEGAIHFLQSGKVSSI